MSRIVISGYYGFGNAGDEAMLAAMIDSLTKSAPGVKITVISGDPLDTRARHGVQAVHRMNLVDIVRSLAACDLLVSGGGSLLQDVTSDRSLYYYLSMMFLAKKLGKPVMMYAQGIGPVYGSAARNAVRAVGNMVDLITVRDGGSLIELQSMGVYKPPVYVTADPVLSLAPADRRFGEEVFRRYGLAAAGPVVGLSVREWKGLVHYKKALAMAADRIIEEKKAQIVFIPMQRPDIEAAQKIASFMRHSCVVLEEAYHTWQLLSLVGNLDMLIGIRLHALIFAAVMRIPLVGISYDPKIDRFLESIGASSPDTLTSVSHESLLAKVASVWPKRDAPDTRLAERVEGLRRKAFHNAELAVGLMKRKSRE